VAADSADEAVAQKYGLVPAMTPGAGTIPDGWNRRENHTKLEKEMRENIERAAAAKVPNVITFSGNRRGLADEFFVPCAGIFGTRSRCAMSKTCLQNAVWRQTTPRSGFGFSVTVRNWNSGCGASSNRQTNPGGSMRPTFA
jgi:hypothetical protein